MTPDGLIEWALCIGIAWIILGSLTGLDDWVKKQFGMKDKTDALEQRVAELERRLADAEKKSGAAVP
jgi:hypothetical protein